MKLGSSHSVWRAASATFIDSCSVTSGGFSVAMRLASCWLDSTPRVLRPCGEMCRRTPPNGARASWNPFLLLDELKSHERADVRERAVGRQWELETGLNGW